MRTADGLAGGGNIQGLPLASKTDAVSQVAGLLEYKPDEDENAISRFFTTAQLITPHLPGAWRYNALRAERCACPHGNRAVINDDSEPGRQLVLCPSWKDSGRIDVQGRMPYGRNTEFSISISATRDPKAIAADIGRRFLQDYYQQWDVSKEWQAGHEEELAAFADKIDLLRRFVPGFKGERERRHLTGAEKFVFSGGTLELFSTPDSSAHVRLRLSFDDLIRVMTRLYGAPAKETTEAPKSNATRWPSERDEGRPAAQLGLFS